MRLELKWVSNALVVIEQQVFDWAHGTMDWATSTENVLAPFISVFIPICNALDFYTDQRWEFAILLFLKVN